jgi:hypothetical protein
MTQISKGGQMPTCWERSPQARALPPSPFRVLGWTIAFEMHAPWVMRVSISGKCKSLSCFESHGFQNTRPNIEISAAIGRFRGSDISRALPRQQDNPPSNDATKLSGHYCVEGD